MFLSDQIQKCLQSLSMLKHPFYQSWSAGTLSIEAIQNYTLQYRPFVNRFPCYVAATLSLSENKEHRRALLHNLLDEEGYPNTSDHPSLWKSFALGIGVSEEYYDSMPSTNWGEALDRNFWDRSRTTFASALGSLYAYEHQIPEVSEIKIKGLKEHFDISDPKTIEFFTLHQVADKYHTEACGEILNSLVSETDKQDAITSALNSAQDLWTFLDKCQSSCQLI